MVIWFFSISVLMMFSISVRVIVFSVWFRFWLLIRLFRLEIGLSWLKCGISGLVV